MTEEITPDALDLGDILSGISYPKDKVTVYLDPNVAYRLDKISKALAAENQVGQDEAKIEELEKEQDKLIEQGRAASLTFHVTGASRADKENVLRSVLEQFPQETDVFGRAKTDPKADEAYANRRWALHIDKIEHSNGSSKDFVTEADVKVFRGQAPDHAVDAVERSITNLESGAKSGFEAISQGHDFLSQP